MNDKRIATFASLWVNCDVLLIREQELKRSVATEAQSELLSSYPNILQLKRRPANFSHPLLMALSLSIKG